MVKKKTQRRLFSFRLAVVALLVLVVAGLISGVYLHYHDKDKKVTVITTSSSATRSPNSINYKPLPGANDANNARKGDSTTAQTLNSSPAPSFSVTISRANGSGSSITAAANVNGTSSGTCVFNFSTSSGGSVVTSSNPENIQVTNQSAECPPVSVTMPYSGTWYVSVTVTNQGSTASAQWMGPPITT